MVLPNEVWPVGPGVARMVDGVEWCRRWVGVGDDTGQRRRSDGSWSRRCHLHWHC
jgi:hypothetical protein